MNRTEFCKPKTKDVDRRRFFETRGQLYRAYPEQLTRMRIREFGIVTGTEEVIVYQENCIHPQIERGTMITPDKIMADIDENKIMTSGIIEKKAWGVLTSKNTSKIISYLPLIMVGLVLFWAFASNGWQL